MFQTQHPTISQNALVTRAYQRCSGFYAEFIYVVPDSFPEDSCGVSIRKKKITDKHGNTSEIEVQVRGFKLITVLWEKGRIPLAAKIVKINEHEVNYALKLIRQAKKNIGRFAE